MGAWIETRTSKEDAGSIVSHPVWVRGLKLARKSIVVLIAFVAPRVGAWIETICWPRTDDMTMSHPVWVRGLKPICV